MTRTKKSSPAKKTPASVTEAAAEYTAAWRDRIAATADPHSLLRRWLKERDMRDDLEIPITQRLELLRQISPEEVTP